ncbi:MAG: class I SAM-dependent RNA methyltransferase [Myxococcota bacterium]
MRIEGLYIQRWAHGGDGVGFPESGPLEGAVVFVPRTVPGDVVTVDVVKQKKRWARGRIVQVERPSPHRVDPPCSVQAACGGCPWMIGDSEAQAASRLAILQGEAAKHLGWDEETLRRRVRLALPTGPELGYRCRVRMAYRVEPGGRVILGYRAGASHEIVHVPTCVVASPRIRQILADVREWIGSAGAGEGEVLLVAGEEGVAGMVRPAGGVEWHVGEPEVTVRHGSFDVRAEPEVFLQANPAVTAAIADQVEEVARKHGGTHAVELFAGVGTLTIPLLKAGYRVTAYEVAEDARRLFEENTAPWGEAEWHRADLLEAGIPIPQPERPDLVLLDPPRIGAAPLMPWVRASGARLAVMVSCDVSTAMRDLATLVEGDHWHVESITGRDMFPHTGHQELVAVARRA